LAAKKLGIEFGTSFVLSALQISVWLGNRLMERRVEAKKLFLTGIAALLMATSAHATVELPDTMNPSYVS
jgi:hypothetical protein